MATLVAVVTITLIVASVICAGREQILESGSRLLLAVFGLHLFGFLFGYLGGKTLLGREPAAWSRSPADGTADDADQPRQRS